MVEKDMVEKNINQLLSYGLSRGLLQEEDRIYATNLLLDLLKADYSEFEVEETEGVSLEDILAPLLDHAFEKGLMESNTVTARDLFDAKIMNCIMPRPSTVINTFYDIYKEDKEKATDYYYKFSTDSDYIRKYRIAKDVKWEVESEYGLIDITINLSKPEKDPKDIAAAKNIKSSGYPKCLLCMENEGYAGHMNHPGRTNHRIIPITMEGSKWGFQYSPYVYYNEHCIIFNGEHVPMVIDEKAFHKLFSFIEQIPHYFVGSNADLPIVGGSILSHEHFQGGNYTFAMEKAGIEKEYVVKGYEDIQVGIVKWPLSVLRARSKDRKKLAEFGGYVLEKWKGYTDEEAFIFANTDGVRHNTITPIARKKGEYYELDLTLRNNITTEERPMGVYHPREEYHHIKKENIGLIEVMGLAILPSRLKEEIELLSEHILEKKDISSNEKISKHASWVENTVLKNNQVDESNVVDVLQKEIGKVFVKVLEDAGVFKCDEKGREYFERFVLALSL